MLQIAPHIGDGAFVGAVAEGTPGRVVFIGDGLGKGGEVGAVGWTTDGMGQGEGEAGAEGERG